MKNPDPLLRCLISLTAKQKDSLDLFARIISRHRIANKKNKKISTSLLIRCLIDIFMEKWDGFDTNKIIDEGQLSSRIKKHMEEN